MKASEKRKAQQKRNIDKKTAERLEAMGIRKAQAMANDAELKALCVRIAMIQEHPLTHDEAGLRKLHLRADHIYKAFRRLPPDQQPGAWKAAQDYVKSGGDVSEFLNFRGLAHGGGKKKLEEHTEQDGKVQQGRLLRVHRSDERSESEDSSREAHSPGVQQELSGWVVFGEDNPKRRNSRKAEGDAQ